MNILDFLWCKPPYERLWHLVLIILAVFMFFHDEERVLSEVQCGGCQGLRGRHLIIDDIN